MVQKLRNMKTWQKVVLGIFFFFLVMSIIGMTAFNGAPTAP